MSQETPQSNHAMTHWSREVSFPHLNGSSGQGVLDLVVLDLVDHLLDLVEILLSLVDYLRTFSPEVLKGTSSRPASEALTDGEKNPHLRKATMLNFDTAPSKAAESQAQSLLVKLPESIFVTN